ncbi:hypothetical protein [Desulfosporosinus sp. BG]|uniref:hypothetical protein n=1 Tax=Desulfosporosinus sp. BG TaxID=1633135 RepID=UPI00114D12AB|nr:hypothetical protein [Desulfosporosinus sp. BG]
MADAREDTVFARISLFADTVIARVNLLVSLSEGVPFSPSRRFVIRHLAIRGDALTSNALFESWLRGHSAIHGQRPPS